MLPLIYLLRFGRNNKLNIHPKIQPMKLIADSGRNSSYLDNKVVVNTMFSV